MRDSLNPACLVWVICALVFSGCGRDDREEAVIVAVSEIGNRDLETGEYPDLLLAFQTREGTLLLPAMTDRAVEALVLDLKPGDRISYEATSKGRWERAQRIDTLPIGVGATMIGLFPERISRGEGVAAIPVEPSVVPEMVHQEEDVAKNERIREQLQKIESRLAENGGTFDAWQDSLAAFRASAAVAVAWEGGISKPEEGAMERAHFRDAVPSEGSVPPLEAIVSLKNQIEGRGMAFLYLSIPLRSELYPEWFGGDPSLDTGAARIELLHELGSAGVEWIDVGEILRAEKAKRGAEFRPFWQASDSHLTPQGHAAVARALEPVIARHTTEPSDYPSADITIQAPGRPELTMSVRQVIVPKTNPTSPIFLAGDSNVFFYQTAAATGCGLPSQLVAETGHYLDWKSIAGMQPHIFGKYGAGVFHGKTLVIYVHTAWLLWDERSPMLPTTLAAE